jgi:hypothetical protein
MAQVPSVPSDYDDDSYVIYANPDLMWQLSQYMLSFAEGAGDNVTNIVNRWNSLNSDWMGPSASAAQDLINSVNQAVGTLMGPQGNPKSGVFEITINGVAQAASNYANIEQDNITNWNAFAASLAAPPAPTAGQQGEAPDVTPTVKTPKSDPGDPFSEVTP